MRVILKTTDLETNTGDIRIINIDKNKKKLLVGKGDCTFTELLNHPNIKVERREALFGKGGDKISAFVTLDAMFVPSNSIDEANEGEEF